MGNRNKTLWNVWERDESGVWQVVEGNSEARCKRVVAEKRRTASSNEYVALPNGRYP